MITRDDYRAEADAAIKGVPQHVVKQIAFYGSCHFKYAIKAHGHGSNMTFKNCLIEVEIKLQSQPSMVEVKETFLRIVVAVI